MISLTSGTPVTQSPTVAVVTGLDESSKTVSRTSFHSAPFGPETRTEKLLDKAKFLTSVRKYVSGTKTTRVSDAGFDLDMTYITSRIIAMAFPASGIEATIRNPRHHVISYLKKRHPAKYLVFNLCGPERRWVYSPSEFSHENARDGAIILPIKDDNIPSLYQLTSFCQQASSWLNLDPDNVIVVHCTSGRTRTGIMVCSLLLATKTCTTADEAISLFCSARSSDKIFSPSHIRLIKLFEELFNLSSQSVPIAITSLGLAQYSWTLDSIEIGLPDKKPVTVLSSVTVRRRSEEQGKKIDLPELMKVKNSKQHSFPSILGGKTSHLSGDTSSPILVDFATNSRFASNEDSHITITLKQGYTKKILLCFWFFAEMTEQMINHRCSSGEGHSTTFLGPDDMDVSIGALHDEKFYVKINVRYNRI